MQSSRTSGDTRLVTSSTSPEANAGIPHATLPEGFRGERIPKYLDWLETILARNSTGSGWLVGADLSYADLSAFQVVEGLSYAFPRAAAEALAAAPLLDELAGRVRALPNIAAYLASPRRIPFNEEGIFRRYPELDAPG